MARPRNKEYYEMRNIWTIARREIKLYFGSPIAYIVGLLIFLIAAMDHPFRGSLRVTCEPFIAHGAHTHGTRAVGGKKDVEASECAP